MLIGVGCGLATGRDAIDVQQVDLDQPVISVTPFMGQLWAVVGPTDGGRTRIVAIDAATGELVVEGGPQNVGGLLWADGDQLWTSAVSQPDRRSIGETADGAVVLAPIDPATTEPVRQVGLGVDPPTAMRLAVLDDAVWMASNSLWRIDPLTGEREVMASRGEFGADQLVVHRDHVWWTDGAGLTRLTGAGDRILDLDFDQRLDWPDVGVNFHDGSAWLSGAVRGEPDLAYRLDPETGDLSDPIEASELPTRSFEADGERWELHNAAWFNNAPEPATDGDVWRRVDIDTGELIADYDLGSSTAVAASGGNLWLLDVDAGVLSWIAISEL